jgi:hypothetical protein
MPERNTMWRSMHDTGLAAWFGGSLMGAVGLNGAAAQARNPAERLQIASAGWDQWAPINFAAICAHLVGAAGILASESPRIAAEGCRRDERGQDGAHGGCPRRNGL